MDGRTDRGTDGQLENSIPTTNKVCAGYKKEDKNWSIKSIAARGNFLSHIDKKNIKKKSLKPW